MAVLQLFTRIFVSTIWTFDVFVGDSLRSLQPEQVHYGKCSFELVQGELHAKCSDGNLKHVISLPKFCVHVSFSNSWIKNITETDFTGMTLLRDLDLSNNPIEYISNGAFRGLLNLERLNLRNSRLYKHAAPDIGKLFADTVSLRELNFTFFYPERYSQVWRCAPDIGPSQNISILKQLDTLMMDSSLLIDIKRSFTPLNPMNVKTVFIINGRFCFYEAFTNDDFHMMPLTESFSLYIEMSRVCQIHEDTFSAFKSLHRLRIEYREKGIHVEDRTISGNVSEMVKNVTEQTSKLPHFYELGLLGLPNGDDLNCKHVFSNLHEFKDLYALILINNMISPVSDCDNVLFPKSLKVLDIRLNCFDQFGILRILKHNQYIRNLDARDQSVCGTFSRKTALNKHHTDLHADQNESIHIVNTHLISLRVTHTDLSYILTSNFTKTIYRNLAYLCLRWNQPDCKKDVSLSANFFIRYPTLKHLDLSGCGINQIDDNALINVTHIQDLVLSSNSLGLMGNKLGKVLGAITSLRTLLIDNNGISEIDTEMFKTMSHLRYLCLQNNPISSFTASIVHLKELRILNISSTRISILSKKTRRSLDMIRQTSRLRLDLGQNKLLCTCMTLDFLQWMQSTNVLIEKKNTYTCASSIGLKGFEDDIASIVTKVGSHCFSLFHRIATTCGVSGLLSFNKVLCSFIILQIVIVV